MSDPYDCNETEYTALEEELLEKVDDLECQILSVEDENEALRGLLVENNIPIGSIAENNYTKFLESQIGLLRVQLLKLRENSNA